MFAKIAILLAALVAVNASALIHGAAIVDTGKSATSRHQDAHGNYAFSYDVIDQHASSKSQSEVGNGHGNKKTAYNSHINHVAAIPVAHAAPVAVAHAAPVAVAHAAPVAYSTKSVVNHVAAVPVATHVAAAPVIAGSGLIGAGLGAGYGAGLGVGLGAGYGAGLGAVYGAGLGAGYGAGIGAGLGAGYGAGIGAGNGLIGHGLLSH